MLAIVMMGATILLYAKQVSEEQVDVETLDLRLLGLNIFGSPHRGVLQGSDAAMGLMRYA